MYKKYITILLAFMFLTACDTFIEEDLNQNPNNPEVVPVQALLANVQIELIDMVGGDFSRFSSLLVQQAEGVTRQWVSINNYSSLLTANYNTTWNNMYASVLCEAINIKRLAIEGGFNHYVAVADVLIAYSLMTATDVWDAIPYSEACLGIENQAASFDSQASIYTEIFALLTEAETLFNGDAGNGSISIDVYYNGDISNWILALNSIRARANLHLGNYAEALTAANAGIDTVGSNMSYTYPDASNSSQWYRFNRDREGDIELHPTIDTLMKTLNDTVRLKLWNPDFDTDHPYFISTFTNELITYREMEFLKAECLLRTSGAATEIREAYLSGIEASFANLGLTASYADYVAQSAIDPGEGNITMEHIMTQKYLGLFTQHEVYNDWRRTDIPTLEPVTGSAIPVRWAYGNDEVIFNPNAPAADAIDIFTDKVGWDQ